MNNMSDVHLTTTTATASMTHPARQKPRRDIG
jgi:hypothetical protein